MVPDDAKSREWLKQIVAALPALDEILSGTATEVLVIGAGVFDIYVSQGWMPSLKRKTGDLDLSVGLVKGEAEYAKIRRTLLAHGYALKDTEPRYRYFPARPIPGAFAYVDLLAHPAGAKVSRAEAVTAMGAGRGWSFAKFEFARKTAFRLSPNGIYPNPIGMIALKAAAFQENPQERLKDLADIAELCSGLVEKGIHFKIGPLWKDLRGHPEANEVRKMLAELGGQQSAKWDLDDIARELGDRGYSEEEIEESIPARLLELVENLPSS